MKKVLCINDQWPMKNSGDPVFGQIYTVTDEYMWGGHLIYKLTECTHKGGYAAIAFVPISSIDETEMIREYKKELA